LLGVGTEKVEGEVRRLLPQARVARMDSDVMIERGAHGRLLRALEQGEIDILVGTQMIVKGHDFPLITVVGIITADGALHLPELRAAERCFQLISQAAGRAGRGSQPGRVIIQTYLPEHYAIQRAKGHDFVGFYEEEMKTREALCFPPLTRMVNIRVSSASPGAAEQGIARLAKKVLRCSRPSAMPWRSWGRALLPYIGLRGDTAGSSSSRANESPCCNA
jgi:primosomal protein N' (replication factor Y)